MQLFCGLKMVPQCVGERSEMSRGMKNRSFDCFPLVDAHCFSGILVTVQAKVPGGMSDLKVVLVSAL